MCYVNSDEVLGMRLQKEYLKTFTVDDIVSDAAFFVEAHVVT